MSKDIIYDQRSLEEQLRLLQMKRDLHEAAIKSDLKEIYNRIQHPVPFIKQSVSELAADKDFRVNLLQIGLNYASDYLVNKLAKPTAGKENLLSVLLNKLGVRSAKD